MIQGTPVKVDTLFVADLISNLLQQIREKDAENHTLKLSLQKYEKTKQDAASLFEKVTNKYPVRINLNNDDKKSLFEKLCINNDIYTNDTEFNKLYDEYIVWDANKTTVYKNRYEKMMFFINNINDSDESDDSDDSDYVDDGDSAADSDSESIDDEYYVKKALFKKVCSVKERFAKQNNTKFDKLYNAYLKWDANKKSSTMNRFQKMTHFITEIA